MKASAFEQRHAMALRPSVYALAFSVYFFDRDDVVWRFIRYSASPRALEHGAFLMATLLIGLGAYLCTQADACAAERGAYLHKRGGLWGDWLYAVGLSTLAPLGGCLILVVGESIRIPRLGFAERHDVTADACLARVPRWGDAFQRQAAKWGVEVTMVAFTVTLIDRVADYGIAASIAVWAALNWTSIYRRGA